MQKFRSTSLLAATIVLAGSFAGSVSAATYKSAYKYTITPPAGWTTTKSMGGAEVVFRSSTRENINVVSQAVPKGTTLEQARSQSIVLLRRAMKNYRLLGQGSTTLGGLRALTLTSGYTMGTPTQKLRAYQAFSLRNGRLFVFTCTAREASFARYAKTFMNSLASVRWTK